MAELYLGVATFLLLNLGACLISLFSDTFKNRKRAPTDRILVAQLFGTTTVGVLLLLAESLQIPALRDVALVFTLLTAPAIVAFVRLPSVAQKEK